MAPGPAQVMCAPINLACLLIPAVIMASLYQPALMSHMQKEEQLMSFCIASSPRSTDTVSVCARVCVFSSQWAYSTVYVCEAVFVLRHCLLF